VANGTLTWLGHGSFRIDTPGGKRVYVDPWLSGPTCPETEREPDRIDVIAVTHAHGDHVSDVAELGRRHGAHLVAMYELAAWLEGQGYPDASSGGMNRGGTVDVDGVTFTMTVAFHSSGTPDGSYGGEPAGYVVGLENGTRVYFAGDTCVFGDMQLIGRLYSPDLAVLPIGDRYTMGPREAALALELLGVRRCVPAHWGTFPMLTGTPAELREHAPSDVEVVDLEPGGSVEL
jgi:L-ascorbate metabolism protein UlaG (beta-lactamase superfamily)